MRRKTIRLDTVSLIEEARLAASDQQKPVLDKMLTTGFEIMKVLRNSNRCAINLRYRDVSSWLTHDGVFHRPVKGKKHVAVNVHTLERIW